MRPFRSTLFAHQDGIALSMVLAALQEKNLMGVLLQRGSTSIGELVAESGCAPGYANIAFRSLASQGWLASTGTWGSPELRLEVTDEGRAAASAFPLYEQTAHFVRKHLPFQELLTEDSGDAEGPRRLSLLVEQAENHWGLLDGRRKASDTAVENLLDHLNGVLVVPALPTLKMLGLLDDERLQPRTMTAALSSVMRLFAHLGWLEADSGRWTPTGREACSYALHYGLMGSYLPMMSRLGQMLFGSLVQHTHGTPESLESHVDRRLNVQGSGAAHGPYFKDAEAIFEDIFNRLPLEEQPRFVADMGCGDGSWLIQLHELIRTRTRRGRHLDRHPLLMIGLDYSPAARELTEANLRDAGIPHLVLFGDVGDPSRLADDLAHHGIDIRDGLHIRSFLDHNRPYQAPTGDRPEELEYTPSGAYVDADGGAIQAVDMERSLVEHLERWVPFVRTHGVVILEAHTVAPGLAARHVGQLHNIAFDTYHGFSGQFPVEFEVFMRACEKAGLEPSLSHQRRYPSRLPFVAISVNRFTVPSAQAVLPEGSQSDALDRTGQWQPDGSENLADGEALHRFLYHDGNLRTPRRWCSTATGVLVRMVVKAMRRRIEEVRQGQRPARLRVLDYGTGTGFAAIELIKACREMGLFEEMEQLGIDFELLLLDIPSGWFAKGFELLRGCDFVRFHATRDMATGTFLPLREVVGPEPVDLIVSSMVFHLVRPAALPELAENLASILAADGQLIWNTPDTGPPFPDSVLFHEPNRRVRRALVEMLENPNALERLLATLPVASRVRYADLPARLDTERRRLGPAEKAAAERAASRQILPKATEASALLAQVSGPFAGSFFNKTFEIRARDCVDGILIPSNQRVLAEIADPDTRSRLAELLMTTRVLPEIRSGPAATSFGVNLHWTFGVFERAPAIRAGDGPGEKIVLTVDRRASLA